MTAEERLLTWAFQRPCIYSKCYRPAVAMTSAGGLEFFCDEHAADVRELSTLQLIDLPQPPLFGDVERVRDSSARRRQPSAESIKSPASGTGKSTAATAAEGGRGKQSH